LQRVRAKKLLIGLENSQNQDSEIPVSRPRPRCRRLHLWFIHVHEYWWTFFQTLSSFYACGSTVFFKNATLLRRMLAACSGKHHVTVWRPSVCLSRQHTRRDSPEGSIWSGTSVHFGLAIRRTDNFLSAAAADTAQTDWRRYVPDVARSNRVGPGSDERLLVACRCALPAAGNCVIYGVLVNSERV